MSLHVTHAGGGVESMSNMAQMIETNIPKYLERTLNEDEYVILKTCNRFEMYVGTDNAELVKKEFESFLRNTIPGTCCENLPFILDGKNSIRHIFRVSCGLDSLIVGENQIQGQVRETYVRSKEEGHVSKYLTKLFDRALEVGKRVRNETRMGTDSLSVGRAAVELAEKDTGGLQGKNIIILGAGSIAATIAKSLSEMGIKTLLISNRTYDRAADLALLVGGTALSKDYLPSKIPECDVMFVATSAPHILVRRDTITSTGERGKPLLVIDVSVPKNVDDSVGDLPGVTLETMDSLQGVAADNILKRLTEISEAERIVNDEIVRIDEEYLEERANVIIGKISRKAAMIRDEEVCRAKARAAAVDVDEVLDDLSQALVSKLLADTYKKLRSSSRDGRNNVMDAAKDLFGLEME